MPKKSAKHHLIRFSEINPLYFFIAFLILAIICAFALRDNNLRMAQLRQAVYSADERGGDVEESLQNLRSFVNGHMNTDLSSGNSVYPPIQLKFTYQRLVQQAGQSNNDQNNSVYTSAQKYCESQIPNGFSGRYRLDCIQQYVTDHSVAPSTTIPDSLYKFDFVSPSWSPDLAGFSLMASIVSLILGSLITVIRLTRRLWQ